jgi:ABC-type uncharacterized transport system ATPase subunit
MEQHDGLVELHLADGTDPAEVMRQVAAGMPVARMELSRPRLEDIFVRLVASESGDDTEKLLSEIRRPAEAEASA